MKFVFVVIWLQLQAKVLCTESQISVLSAQTKQGPKPKAE